MGDTENGFSKSPVKTTISDGTLALELGTPRQPASTEPVVIAGIELDRQVSRRSSTPAPSTINRGSAATAALTASAERRELRELQARHRGNSVLVSNSNAPEAHARSLN